MGRIRVLTLVTVFALGPLHAQKPVFQASGVINAASLVATNPPSVAPQMLVAIFGQNLASGVVTAPGPSFPRSLGGTGVTFNGIAAPLLYVSPGQINAQVPAGLQAGGAANIVVTTAAGPSDPVSVRVHVSSFGIFSQDVSGCGAGSVLNIHADGSLALNTPANSYDPLSDAGLAVFFTGLGSLKDRQDGEPWTYNPADNLAANGIQYVNAFKGVPEIQVNQILKPLYAGPAPGLVGVDQMNVTSYQTDQIFEGCRTPLYLGNFSNSASQTINVSVHKGGGACVDPPPTSLAIVNWQKTTVYDIGGATQSESVGVRFLQGQQLQFPLTPLGNATTCCSPLPSPSLCAVSLPGMLDAGALTVTGAAAGPITLTPAGGYRADLPAGSLHGGTYQLSAAGGTGVGAFTASAAFPAPVAITASPAPGTTLSLPYRIEWTGGDSGSVMSLQMVINSPGSDAPFIIEVTVPGAAGHIDAPSSYFCGVFCGAGIIPTGDVELILKQQPASAGRAFPAPGLLQGGEQTFTYTWDFRALKH